MLWFFINVFTLLFDLIWFFFYRGENFKLFKKWTSEFSCYQRRTFWVTFCSVLFTFALVWQLQHTRYVLSIEAICLRRFYVYLYCGCLLLTEIILLLKVSIWLKSCQYIVFLIYIFFFWWLAIATLWIEFVREVRWCWEESQPLPRMLTKGSIDLSTCLIHQKLQMVILAFISYEGVFNLVHCTLWIQISYH